MVADMFTGGIRQGKTPNLNKLVTRLSKTSPELRVGIMETATTQEGDKVASIAFWNEYGTTRIPARPFMRQTFDEHAQKWKKVIVNRAKATPEDFIAGFELAGEVAVKDMNMVIEKTGDFAPNAPSTIKKKGEDKGREAPPPLIDTGTMRDAITYEVKT